MDQREIDRIQQQWLLSHVAGHCLHVGCGEKSIAGAVNIDPNPDRGADFDYDVQDLPLVWDETFDSVVSSHVLQAVAEPVLALREMARVLKPGGVIAHVIPDHRYAPVKRDPRFPFQWMHNVWYGPDDFLPVMEQVPGMLIAELKSFPEFNWSFRVVAIRVDGMSLEEWRHGKAMEL